MRFLFLVLGAFLLGAGWAGARQVPDWPFDKLVRESDVVAIVEPASNYFAKQADENRRAVVTTFKVLGYLKGGTGTGKVLVNHFIWEGGAPVNGGTMINFLTGPLDIEVTGKVVGKTYWKNGSPIPARWLAFLKRDADGEFVPVSGQQDPDFSFRELHDAGIFNLTDGFYSR